MPTISHPKAKLPFLMLLTLMFSIPPLSVHAAEISGKITSSGNAVSSACVNIFQGSNGCYQESLVSTTTDANGDYTVTVPDGSQYYVRTNVNCMGAYSDLLDEYWDGSSLENTGTSNCNEAVITPPAPAENINFQLDQAPVIKGIVTDPSGNPVSNVSVSIQSGECVGWSRANHVTWTSTNQDGTYSVNVPPGADYYVYVSPDTGLANNSFVFGYWTGPSPAVLTTDCTQGVAVPDAVIGNTVENINLQLVEGAVIEGTITTQNGETEDPVSGAYVMAREIATSNWWPHYGHTDIDGNYRIVLPHGAQYYVYTGGGQNGLLLGEYWDGANNNGTFDPNLAQPTTALQVGTPTTIDFSLNKAPLIQGIVTDPSGNPVSNASVIIQSGECIGWSRANQVAWTSTNQDGTYNVPVPPGADYYVYVSPQTNTDSNLLFGFWTGPSSDVASSECTQGIAVPEAVIGNIVDNINLQLVEGAVIEGTVTTPSGETDVPVSGAYVMAREITNNNFWPYSGNTDIDGKYRILLPPGAQYIVSAGGVGNGLFLQEYWNGAGNNGTFDPGLALPTAALQVGTPTIADFSLDKAPLIQGIVTDPSGNPVSNASVSIQSGECYGYSRANQVAWTSTNQDGTYNVTVPPGADYYVYVSPQTSTDNNLLFGFWTGPSPAVVSSECTQGIVVPEAVIGNIVDNINLQLVEGAVIEGTVTTPSGETDVPVSGAYVMAREITNNNFWPYSGNTDIDGKYRILLPPGAQYYVSAGGVGNGLFLQEYWNGAGNNGTFDPGLALPTAALQVGTPTIADFSLDKAPLIQGIVTDPSGNPVSNASVSIQSGECYGYSRANQVAWTSTNQDGTYNVTVPPGADYYVYVSPQTSTDNNLLFGFWTGPSPAVVSSECTQGIVVPEAVIGNIVDNINLQLVEGAVIEGTVTTPSGETDVPVSGAYVMAREITNNNFWPYSGNTDIDGKYRILLPPGAQYYVYTGGGQNGLLLGEYWDGAGNNGTFDPGLALPTAALQVGTPTIADFSLEKGVAIQGIVTDTSGNPVSNASISIQSGECYGYSRANQVAWTSTNQDGSYSVTVPPGADYYVYGSPQFDTNTPLLSGYWTGQSPAVVSADCNQGIAVPEAVAGNTVENIDLQLVEGAVLEGTITTPNGEIDEPVSGVYVMAREINTSDWWPYGSQTGTDGTYQIVLPPGAQYYVYATAEQNRFFFSEFWNGTENNGTYDPNLAQPTVALKVGTPTIIDFSLEEGVKIIGQVKDENTGENVDDILVMATTQRCENNNQIAYSMSTTVGEQKGFYQLLVPKDMTVYIQTCVGCASNNDYMDIWYPQASAEIACENATGVSVPSGATELTGIDLLLPTDTDRDGVSDADEINIYGTDPAKSDSDGDGLNDGGEVYLWGSDFDGDIDGDLILNIHETDADNDGVSDRQEFARGSHPDDFKNPNSTPPPLTLYEDFSAPTLDPEKWEVGQYGMEVKDNALQLFAHAPNSKKVYARLKTTVDENLKTTFMITDLAKNTSDSQWLYYSNLGVYYSENIDPDLLTGRVASTIYVGDRGNGLEAWYWIGRTLNENEDTEDYKVGVLLPAGSPLMALNTQYSMEIRYDGNNGFTYTLFDEAGTTLSQVFDTGPALVSPIDKHLSAKVKTPESGGKIAVVIDKVETSAGANPYTSYDTFDGASLDSTKWNEPEISKGITPEGKLRMLAHSFGDKRTTAANSTKRFSYIETRVVFDQDSIVSAPSTIGRARLAMTLYNDTYGPDPNSNPVVGLPHNGYEGNVWGSVYIDYIEGRGLVAKAYAERAEDPNWDTYKELFWQELDIELQFGVEYVLSIGFSNNIMVFGIDAVDGSQHAVAADTIATPKYLPFNPDTQLITRVYGNGSEARQMAYFDDVRVSGEPLEVAGDVNVDGAVNLQDVILTLQAMAGRNDIPVWSTGDVNGDHLIGLPEIIAIMNSL